MNQLNQLLVLYLTMPASDFYITKIIARSDSPVLEPLSVTNVDLGSADILGAPVAFSLQSLNIAGLSNIQIQKEDNVPKITVDGDQVTFYAVRPNTEAPPAGIPANLLVSCQLIVTANGIASPPVPITITIAAGSMTGIFDATGDATNPDSVQIVFTNVTVGAQATPSNISFDLSQLNSFLKPQIEAYLTQPSTLDMLIRKMNDELESQSILNSLSQGATSAAQNALGQIIST